MGRLSLGRGLVFAATALVVSVVIIALWQIEGPDTMRERRFDARRAHDLDNLAAAVNCYWTLTTPSSLPADLRTLAQEIERVSGQRTLPRSCESASAIDPETGEAYFYRVVDDSVFELCATFAHDGDRHMSTGSLWRHGSGKHCFIERAKRSV